MYFTLQKRQVITWITLLNNNIINYAIDMYSTEGFWGVFFLFVVFCLFVCFWLCSWHVKFPRQGIEPTPQEQIKPLQWQCWILNVLPHKRTLGLLILARWSTVKAGKQGICSWVRFYLISEAIFILLRLLPANGSVGLHILWPHKAPAWDKSYEQCPYISVSWSLS